MRRMYSEKELTDIIKKVSEDYIDELIEDGEFDQKIEDYINAYLVEHPVDPTAITGLDIAPKDVSASGNITGASIIENMSGYEFVDKFSNVTLEYLGVVKNGNKLTFVASGYIESASEVAAYTSIRIARINIPSVVGAKLVANSLTYLDNKNISAYSSIYSSKNLIYLLQKNSSTQIEMIITTGTQTLAAETKYNFRIESTFLLSDSLVA